MAEFGNDVAGLHPHAFERATLHHIRQHQVTLLLRRLAEVVATVHRRTLEVAGHEIQAGHAEGGEIVVITGLPGFFVGLDEPHPRPVHQKRLRDKTAQGWKVAVTEHALISHAEAVPALFQRGHGTVGTVVDVAVEGVAVFAVVEVTQVGL
ncbi:hypothetical protein D3C81_1079840 [compost metagenome]